MGYDLHITRADFHFDSDLYPISRAEWTAFADTEPQLIRHTGENGGECWELLTPADGSWQMNWVGGQITIWKGGHVATQLAQIAARLGARVVGDDAEEHFPDGSEVPWHEPRPILFHRAWTVAEAAAAWQTIFERREGLSSSWYPGPDYAPHALGAFRTFADRAVATADVPGADRLSYGYGPAEGADGPVFTLRLARHLITDSDGGQAHIACRLDYPITQELAALGTFDTSWSSPAEADRSTRDDWFDAVAARPEWRLFALITPRTFDFEA
ncbi:hypothetical protein KDL01_19050 [Actinospica durhamensis]|uniref:Uncharacterized protein n=1 Tax=Actinospica durhamensis TaxID=1508375 RepID=A0A941ING4_9ACTN|nr:hypothetical protein [Actinospica durhamensis]MBR7835380.1 hypothetical protein [Actinospica durhamensis]